MTTPIPHDKLLRIVVDPVKPRIPDVPSDRVHDMPRIVVDPVKPRIPDVPSDKPSGVELRVQQPQQRNLQEDDLEKALKRLEELRQRETKLFEQFERRMRIDWWKVPRLRELLEPPFAISPWQWAFKPIPKPLPLPRLPPLRQRHREAVPA